MTFQYVNSLRSRYAAVAAVLIILVLAGALLAHQNVVDTRNETTANIEVRNRIHQTSRHIRDAVWQARESLEAFLLDPHGNAHREHIYASIGQAKRYTEQLARQPWIETHAQGPSITQLQRCLEELEKASENLIATRMDAIRQYPALGFARETMLPRHREFYTAATLAMDEILAEAPDDVRSSSYQSFVRARHLWTQMVSLFRMYLANRLGSFNESALRVQERDIETQYQGLTQELALLKNMSRGNKLGMQASASLDELVSTAEGWHKGFEEVRRINSSGEWRTDGKQIKQIIQPLLETIWGALVSLDVSIENSANQDVQALTRLAQTQTQTLWLLTVLGLVFIGAGFIALERSVLRPIATVAHALKTEASGGEVEILPQATSRETQDLVDAFAEMRNQVHNRQLALEHQALHDALTNLPNRSLLLDRLQQAIYSARRQNSFLALFMMDLDRFKEINDTLGHQVGDSLLKEVGARLLATLRQTDTVARLGGDEFALLLPATDVDNAKSIAVKTLAALEQVFKVDDHHLYVSASIGIAVYPQHGATAQMLVQRADVAMYVAKRSKIDYAVYDREQDQHSVGRLALMSDLRQAIDADTLKLHYQPKLDINTGQVTGAEALLRWQHPEYGPLAPDQVIPLAEQTGLIKPLTLWVLEHAVQQSVRWRQQGIELNIAVNLSVYNLQDSEFASHLQQLLARYKVPPRLISLEITESAMMADPARAKEILSYLDEMGVWLSVDDFGTGFSSLSHLKQLPVDELKIDKSFVMTMIEDDNDAVIVRSTIDLAHNLGLKVVAEGVENLEIWNLLEILRCDAAQGYYLSHPLSADQLQEWLASREIEPRTAIGKDS